MDTAMLSSSPKTHMHAADTKENGVSGGSMMTTTATEATESQTRPLLTHNVMEARIKEILADADLETLTAKSVRQQLEKEFHCDLADRKGEVDGIIMATLNSQTAAVAYAAAEPPTSVSTAEAAAVSTPARRGGRGGGRGGSSATKRTPKEPKLGPDGEKIPRRTGLTVPMLLSDQLADVLGVVEMSRCDVVRNLWVYIKNNELQDPKDKRYFLCDEKLKAIFGKDRLSGFEMNKYIGGHMQRMEKKPMSSS